MTDAIKNEFKNPSSEYRSAPFWSWNGDMKADELARQLEDFKAHGIGGGFAHPRIGMTTEYLSEEYFEAWRGCLEAAKKLDMKLYMYDENTWPSGMAGGKVRELDPSTIGTIAKYKIVPVSEAQYVGELLFAGALDSNRQYHVVKVLTDIPCEEWSQHTDGDVFLVYTWYPIGSNFGPYPDVSNPRTTELFLETTYDEYANRFGEDFGDFVPAVFSDEAHLSADGMNTVPFTSIVEQRFREIAGYDIRPNIAAVFRNITGVEFDRPTEKIRYDFFVTMHDLWINNFVIPIADWCKRHNIAWTGHDVEHQWPQSHGGRILPSEQTTYEFRQWPGIDLLLCDDLRETPNNFDKFLMYEVRSAANQFAKKRTLCEAYGAGGYHSTLYDYKRLSDFLLVGGINVIVQHLSLYSYVGVRKRDCPQSFDYRQPWWNEYTEFADYLARASYMLSQGKMEQRILLINTSTTSYTIPPEEQVGTVDHGIDSSCVKNPDMSDFLTIVDELTDMQWDFDIGDEYSLERHGKVENGKLRFGEQLYDVVIVSKNMHGMRHQTAELLAELSKSGGKLITTDSSRSEIGEYIDGELGRDETAMIRNACDTIDGAGEICAYLEKNLHVRAAFANRAPTGVQHMRRLLPDGRVCYFFVNHSMDTFKSTLTLDGDCAARWDLFTGDVHGISCEAHDGKISFPVKLDRCGSIMIVVGDNSPADEASTGAPIEVEMKTVSITRETDNTLSIDHIALEVDGERHEKRYFLEACDNLFSARGMREDIWRGAQPKTAFLDRNANYGEGSGFAAHYTFTIANGAVPAHLTAAVERPNIITLTINGHKVESTGRDILDPDMGSFDITEFVREGENDITISADVFCVHHELEAIILRGDFAVTVKDEKFIIEKSAPLSLGSWHDMGLVFYPYAVNYAYSAKLDKAPRSAQIKLGEYGATAVSVRVNGNYAGVIGRDGGDCLEIGEFLTEGDNEIVIHVCGSLRNQLGPHLNYQEHTPYGWEFFTRGREAAPSEYSFSLYGLFTEPKLLITE